MLLYFDSSTAGLFLDPPDAPGGLAKFYRPGRYYVDVWTDQGVADPFSVSGDAVNLVRTQDGAVGVPAQYYFDVPTRTGAGFTLRFNAPGGQAVRVSNLIVVHEDFIDHKGEIYFDPEFVDFMKRFTAFRDMESRFGNEYASTITNAGQIATPAWNAPDEAGMPIEFAIALCNAADLDYQVMIPPGLGLDDLYITSLAVLCRDTLRPQLRAIPFYANEIWMGNGIDYGFKNPANVVNSVIAVQLGYHTFAESQDTSLQDAAFTNRMRAQAYVTNLIHERFETVFAQTPDRFFPIVEHQNNSTQQMDIMATWPGPSGRMMKDYNVQFRVAPYFPNGQDWNPWHTYDPSWTPAQKEAFFIGVRNNLATNITQALQSVKAIVDRCVSVYPGCSVGTYEGGDQIGVPFSIPPEWTNPTTVFFPGQAVMFGGTVWTAKYASTYQVYPGAPLMTNDAFIPSEWNDTGAINASQYTTQQRENATIGITVWHSTALCEELYLQFIEALFTVLEPRDLNDKLIFAETEHTWYKLYSSPGYQQGFRCFGAERGEQFSATTDYSYTGPYGPVSALLKTTIRPNGELPGVEPPPPPPNPTLPDIDFEIYPNEFESIGKPPRGGGGPPKSPVIPGKEIELKYVDEFTLEFDGDLTDQLPYLDFGMAYVAYVIPTPPTLQQRAADVQSTKRVLGTLRARRLDINFTDTHAFDIFVRPQNRKQYRQSYRAGVQDGRLVFATGEREFSTMGEAFALEVVLANAYATPSRFQAADWLVEYSRR
jgi:hypothetical protein